MSRKTEGRFLLAALVAVLIAVMSYASAMAQAVNGVEALCQNPSGYYVQPAGAQLPAEAPCEGSWWFEAQGVKTVQGQDWATFRSKANGVYGTVNVILAEKAETTVSTADAPQPMPTIGNPAPTATLQPQPTQVPQSIPDGWGLNPALPGLNPQMPYPGLREAYVMSQQSDGLERDIEVTVAEEQMLVMHGDFARIPGIGEVGGANGCYLVVALGPVVWDTQPSAGELPVIHWYKRSSWELHKVGPGANPLQWAATVRDNLSKAYPATCGKGVQVWTYGEPWVNDVWSKNTDVIGTTQGFSEVSTFTGLCARAAQGAFLVLNGNETLLGKAAPCQGLWFFETNGVKDTEGSPWDAFVTEANGKNGTVWLTSVIQTNAPAAATSNEPATDVAPNAPTSENETWTECWNRISHDPSGNLMTPSLEGVKECLGID